MASLSLRPLLWVCFAPCVTLPGTLFTTPTPTSNPSFCWSIIWILFSLCYCCYSQNAKSEIEEVTHVICLALVCLDAALSAMKTAYTPTFISHKTKTSNRREAFVFHCLHAVLSHCTAAVYFNMYMHICKCIIINIIIVMGLWSFWFEFTTDECWHQRWVNQCCFIAVPISYILFLERSSSYLLHLYILHLWLRQSSCTYLRATLKIFLDKC